MTDFQIIEKFWAMDCLDLGLVSTVASISCATCDTNGPDSFKSLHFVVITDRFVGWPNFIQRIAGCISVTADHIAEDQIGSKEQISGSTMFKRQEFFFLPILVFDNNADNLRNL